MLSPRSLLLFLIFPIIAYTQSYQQLSDQVFQYQNYARQNPQAIMQLIQAKIPYFQGKVLREPGKPGLMTSEGVSAYNEAVSFLQSQQPVNVLTYSLPLALAASDQCNDEGPTGVVGHRGYDGSTPFQRMDRYMQDDTSAENIAYGVFTPQDIMIAFIVDDGVPDRGHRKVLYSSTYNKAATACGCHKVWNIICDFTYAQHAIANSNLPTTALSSSAVLSKTPTCAAVRAPGYTGSFLETSKGMKSHLRRKGKNNDIIYKYEEEEDMDPEAMF